MPVTAASLTLSLFIEMELHILVFYVTLLPLSHLLFYLPKLVPRGFSTLVVGFLECCYGTGAGSS